MHSGLKIIVDFVEGHIDGKLFEKQLYENTEVETALNQDKNLPANHYVGRSVYYFILEQDFDDPGGILNVQGALSDFLIRNGIACTPATTYESFYDILLAAQPGWLYVDTAYIKNNILPEAESISSTQLKDWLHNKLLEKFRFVEHPPNWLQSPSWPINENGPLVFLGEITLDQYFHDSAAVYVFHDPKSGHCETIIQVC